MRNEDHTEIESRRKSILPTQERNRRKEKRIRENISEKKEE